MQFPSHMQGVGGAGSQRAEDMEAKLLYLRTRHGARVCMLMTATPVANSLAEIFVMQTYLQPEALAEAQITSFDSWAANFGQMVNMLELAPDGSTYRIGSRFAKFRNVPDLMRMFRAVADVRTPEELALLVPDIYGGAVEIVVVPSTPAHKQYMAVLAERAEAVRSKKVSPEEDNMLKISTDGRKAALHMRLIDLNSEEGPLYGAGDDMGHTKVHATATCIADLYRAHKDLAFLDGSGKAAPRTGGFQLLFCDLGTPHDNQWSVYSEVRSLLVAAGVPENMVRFMHEAKDDRAKAELFAACRDGRVAVLVASTEKAGVGTNIQARMIALHHLDCPWRPCDIEQREGRGIRQGNQNKVIRIVRYVTEQTFDTYLWQTVARKAAFIYQVMSGKYKGREVDDLGEQALSYAEVKALATGNPLLMEQAGIDNAVAKLVRSQRAHDREQGRLHQMVETSATAMDLIAKDAAAMEAAIAQRTNISGDFFGIDVEGQRYTDRAEAGSAILVALRDNMYTGTRDGVTSRIGTIAGLPLMATWRVHGGYGHSYYGTTRTVTLRIKGSTRTWPFEAKDLDTEDPGGLVRSLEYRLVHLEDDLAEARYAYDRHQAETAAAHDRIGSAFPHQSELDRLTRRAVEIAAEIRKIAEDQEKERGAA